MLGHEGTPKEKRKVPPFLRIPHRQTWIDSSKMTAKGPRKGTGKKEQELHKGTKEKGS